MNENEKLITKYKNYLIAESKSKQTIQSYTRTIRQFLNLIGKNPDNIDENDLQKFKLYAVQTYGSNTLTPKYSAINIFMKVIGKSRDWREEYHLKSPRQYTPNKNPLTIEEVTKMFKVTEHDYKENAMLKVFYYGLLRRNELSNLNLEDIDYNRNKIKINSGKGNKYSTINLHPDCIESIKKYLTIRQPKNPNDKALFINIFGNRIKHTEITNTLKRTAFKVGIKKRVYPHLFRISGITHMAQKGINLKIIQQQSRHSDLNTLMGYIQPTDEESRDEYIRGMSLNDIQPKQKKPYGLVKPTEETQPKLYHKVENDTDKLNRYPNTKRTKDEDKTDKYIALLQKGLIGKDDFLNLIGNDNKDNQNTYIQ